MSFFYVHPVDINNGIETLGDLAFKFWDDLDFSDADACLTCLIENMPVTDHPKYLLMGRKFICCLWNLGKS